MKNTIIGTARGGSAGFPGFPPEGLAFLRSLKRNNRREWFQPRKHIYDEKVRAPMVALVSALTAAMMKFAPDYVREPEAAIYRVYRDTRFSPDKTPYKTHVAAIFPRRGLDKHACAGLYFSVSPETIEIAGGVYMPTPDELRAIRLYLLDRHQEFRRIMRGRTLRALMGELMGAELARVPKGFCAEHPAADLVRCKQWLLDIELDPALAATPKLYEELVKRFRAMTPFVEFLNAPLVAGRRGPQTERFFA
ncbi:MAG: DUF2461 domain-containing protein [Bryobacteraceae bacterium]|jgi:uncharacterized protein (TIGR02453 family)